MAWYNPFESGDMLPQAWNWLNKKPGQTDPANAQLGEGGYMTGIIKEGLGGVQGRAAPTLGGAEANRAQDMEWRRRQIDLANRLSGIEAGTQKGAGALAVDDAARRALASQQSLAAMGRGGNAALAARTAARTSADIGGQMAGQSAQAQMGDQAAARQALMGLTSGAREQDIGIARTEADRAMTAQIANLDANMKQRALNDSTMLGYLAQLFGISAAEMHARLKQEEINATGQTNMQTIGQIAGAGASVAAMGATGGVPV